MSAIESGTWLVAPTVAAFETAVAKVTTSAEEPPMVLAKTGYLFAGGKIDSSVPGSPMTGHMYVEYFIPGLKPGEEMQIDIRQR